MIVAKKTSKLILANQAPMFVKKAANPALAEIDNQLMSDKLFAKVRELIAASINIGQDFIYPASSLLYDLEFEKHELEFYELSTELPKEFNCKVSDEESDRWCYVRDVCLSLSPFWKEAYSKILIQKDIAQSCIITNAISRNHQ